MKLKLFHFSFAAFFMLVLPVAVFSQGFGQNKIQYQARRWQFIQSEHYDIYFYEGGATAAKFTAAVAESSYHQISRRLNFKMQARTPILVYNSHNDFEETNVSAEIQDESVGGFTEFFKNRVVLPYEGSLEQFRHVIHHELVHAMHLQFFYGTGTGAAIRGISGFAWPLWFGEGMAEYFARHWDAESDNFIRDAVVSGYLPPIPQLNGFLAYKGGQALAYWMENRYGAEKVTKFNQTLRRVKNVDRAIREAFGMTMEDFSDAWHQGMREEYWPEIARRTAPADLATQVTNHVKSDAFINNSPALSPSGDRLVYISDRAGKFDIYVTSTLEMKKPRRLVSGQKESGLEELHWLRPGITWSPDGKKIAFAAKAGAHDAIHLVDVERGKIIRTYQPKLDGLWSPAWSPGGKSIAFMGMKDGRSDIMLLNLDNGEIARVTNDAFSDLDPAWSPDGKAIAFVSDRGAFAGKAANGQTVAGRVGEVMPLADFANTDIFLIRPDGTGLQQITTSPYAEKSPTFFHNGDSLLFVSDLNGIDNIYLYDRTLRAEKPLTNLLTGANQLAASASGDRVAFTAFSRGGYDIFLWKSPFAYADTLRPPALTRFREREQKQSRELSLITQASHDEAMPTLDRDTRPYNKFVFDHDFRSGKIGAAANGAAVVLSSDQRLDPDGSFKIQKYRRKFSVDYAGGAGGYDPFWGLQGYTQFYISDLAGNQQLGLGINLIRNISNSDFYLSWANLAHRANFGVQFFHVANFFQTDFDVTRVRNLGVEIGMAYPLSRFKRVEAGLNFTHLRENNLGFYAPQLPTRVTNAFPLTAAYVSDNAHFRFFGPFTGTRYRFGLIYAHDFGSRVVSFQTGFADFRNYFGISRDFGVAWRVSGGVSGGKDPMRFFLGGVDNWLNYKFGQDLNAFDITDFYFSQFVTPLRGADYYEMIGTRYALLNLELRVPLVDYFIARFPLPLGIAGIRGAGFLDVGSAWNSDKRFRATEKNANGETVLRDIIAGYGWGFRANLGIFLLRMDAVWRTDLAGSSKPRYLFSFGTDF
jgi:Tol biopolymer transport system component